MRRQNSPIRLPFLTHLFAVIVIVLTSTPSVAAESIQGDELLTMNMRNADISEVIQWIAEQTGKNIVVDPRVRGNVTVLSNAPMTVTQAYRTFLSLLDIYGFAASEVNGILRIYPAAMAKSSPSQLIRDFTKPEQVGGQILYVFTANSIPAEKLSALIKPLIPPSGYIASLAETNSLLISDEMENVKRLIQLLTQLDRSGDLSIEVIPLQYASAKSVTGLVLSLLKSDGAGRFAISSDDRSNSLLLSGDEGSKEKIRRLVRQLDRSINSSGNTRVIHLAYLDAAEMLPILRGLSTAMISDSSNKKDVDGPISIEMSESSNAIIMTAPPSIMDAMAEVVNDIDIKRAQVLVEAIIVEVSQTYSETLGVEWNSALNNTSGVEAATDFGVRALTAAAGSGLSLGIYRHGSLRMLINALSNETGANILSTPSIVTLDNETAAVLVGSNIPLISGQATADASTDSPFTTIERRDIGLSLKVTPQVNEQHAITLDILQEIETVSPSAQFANDIVTDKRSIKTRVLVENDSILVLGGLISTEQSQLVRKVPLLGDIPLLGALFRSSTEQTTKKNLMVFIHPSIIDTAEKSQLVSAEKYRSIKALSENYNSDKLPTTVNSVKDFIEFKPQVKAQ